MTVSTTKRLVPKKVQIEFYPLAYTEAQGGDAGSNIRFHTLTIISYPLGQHTETQGAMQIRSIVEPESAVPQT